jgi:hypothetical protein
MLIKSNKDSNTNFIADTILQNKFLEEKIKEAAKLSKNTNSEHQDDNNLFNLITDYKKNLFKENIMKNFYLHNNIHPYTDNDNNYDININENNYNINYNSNIKDIKRKFDSIFLQKNKNTNFESFFNSTKFTWETITSKGETPKSTKGFSMVLSGTTIIIFGGRDLNDKYYNDMYFFDLQKKTWTKISPKGVSPKPRAYHSAIIRGTVMWIFGGSSDSGYLNDLYSFDLETVIKFYKYHNYFSRLINLLFLIFFIF